MIGEFQHPDQRVGQRIMAEDIRHLIDAARQTFNISALDPLHVDILPSGMHLWKDEEPEVWLAKTTGTITAFVQTTITRTATLVNGSAVITGLSQTSDLTVGMTVSGTGIVPGSTINSIDSSSQVTLNLACTASGSQSLTFSSDQMGSGTVDLYKLFNPTSNTWFSADTLIAQTVYSFSTSTIATGTYVLLFQDPFSKRLIIGATAPVAATGVKLNVNIFTTLGTSTWTKPANLLFIIVEVVGGGGGNLTGGTSSFKTVSATGGGVASVPGANVLVGTFALSPSGSMKIYYAHGVNGAPGIGSGGDINLRGPPAGTNQGIDFDTGSPPTLVQIQFPSQAPPMLGTGGQSGFSGTVIPSGYGAGCNGIVTDNGTLASTLAASGNGGSGGYALKKFDASALNATETVTVGAGGGNVDVGNAAVQGVVVVYEYTSS